MPKLTFEQIQSTDSFNDIEKTRGTFRNKRINKSARFYHVMTHSWGMDNIFYMDVAGYRHRLLCSLCEKNNVTILFSVTMPNHTHEVVMSDRWENISKVFRCLNSQVSHYLRSNNEDKYKNKKQIFDYTILYVPIMDIGALFYEGKYLYDNPSYLKENNKRVPHSCFWMFEAEHFTPGYKPNIYKVLFGLTPNEILKLYADKTKQEIAEYSKKIAANWNAEDTIAVFGPIPR